MAAVRCGHSAAPRAPILMAALVTHDPNRSCPMTPNTPHRSKGTGANADTGSLVTVEECAANRLRTATRQTRQEVEAVHPGAMLARQMTRYRRAKEGVWGLQNRGPLLLAHTRPQIGRASCRERVEMVVARGVL